MWNKLGSFVGKLFAISIYILVFCGSLAAVRLAVCLIRWAINGTFIL